MVKLEVYTQLFRLPWPAMDCRPTCFDATVPELRLASIQAGGLQSTRPVITTAFIRPWRRQPHRQRKGDQFLANLAA